MAYTIDKFDGATVTVVQDGTINTALDIKLVGKDYPGYGEIQNENFVFMLENFAGTTAPTKPMNGQLWYDSASKKIKFYDKAATKWKAASGAESAATAPTGLAAGDLWFDTVNQQLNVWNGTSFVMVGPENVAGFGKTLMRSVKVQDSTGAYHPVIQGIVNDSVMFIVNTGTEFTLNSNETALKAGGRYNVVRVGTTMAFTDDDGIGPNPDDPDAENSQKYWGTARNADMLGGIPAANFVTSAGAHFPDSGIYIGDEDDLHTYIDPTGAVISNTVGNTITFKVNPTGTATTVEPLKIVNNTLLPGTDNTTVDIGSSAARFQAVYATAFHGQASSALGIDLGGITYAGRLTATANTTALRDSSGNLTANVFNGVATSARYADLAEKYLTDEEYEVGTVMMVGGEAEVTASIPGKRPIGVISENPAFMMNSELEGGQYVALKGRVPVKVHGAVKKGDELTAWHNGTAIPGMYSSKVFAIALESNDNEGVKLVEAVIL